MAHPQGLTLTSLSQHGCFDGTVGIYSHLSEQCRCKMKLAVFIPPQAKTRPVPEIGRAHV